MQTFQRILVPIDFSSASQAALRLAGRLGGRDSTVLVLNVVTAPPLPNVAYANVPAALEEQRRENEARIAGLDLPAGPEGPRLERRVVVGEVADAIVETARATGAEVVVIASEGGGGLHRALHGSVAEAVVREAPCHVLVVREPA